MRDSTAFYGVDNGIPRIVARNWCQEFSDSGRLHNLRYDGMPLVFSHEIDFDSLDVKDFVITQSNQSTSPVCATLMPAVDEGEKRTVLLIGRFASGDSPIQVRINGDLYSKDGKYNYRNASILAVPLSAGPSLVHAELVPDDQWELGYGGGNQNDGTGCPLGTEQIIRVAWDGGVTKPGGAEVDDVERMAYQVSFVNGATEQLISPFALGDLNDGDNNHKLCFDEYYGQPTSIYFPGGLLTDPNEDMTNSEQRYELLP